MDIKQFDSAAKKLKTLAHPCWLCIIRGLMDEACNVTKIQGCLQIPQSTVSQHLTKLKDAGIIEGVRHGNEVCYRVVDEEAAALISLLIKKE